MPVDVFSFAGDREGFPDERDTNARVVHEEAARVEKFINANGKPRQLVVGRSVAGVFKGGRGAAPRHRSLPDSVDKMKKHGRNFKVGGIPT